MRLKLSLLTVLLGAMLIASAPAATAAPPSAGISGPVTGTCSFVTATGETVTGSITNGLFTVTGFSAPGGVLSVTGTLTGTCTAVTSAGQVVTQAINQTVTTAVAGAQGSCRILHLEIGPINLDLLGLQVDTNRIVLDITAQSGPGNLLGNLLCAVANALNGGAPGNVLANLLNQILAILR